MSLKLPRRKFLIIDGYDDEEEDDADGEGGGGGGGGSSVGLRRRIRDVVTTLNLVGWE